jgi:hydroxymethylpyrimidine/phosphomethylpyrimidine kinase
VALGEDVATAVRNAKRYVTRVIRHALAVGHGHAVGDTFYFSDAGDWEKP